MFDSSKESDKTKNVLVVDDEADVLIVLKEFLSKIGFNVMTSCGGRDALEIVKSNPVHLVLLDIAMPELDGISTLREIKKIRPKLLIVMITGNSSSHKIVEAFSSGAYDYLIKPIDFSYLRECVVSRLM
ncbi:MAG: response regulator [Endomicrobiales bacterium]|nr:response regulator [Endomicrobiales bacterium]